MTTVESNKAAAPAPSDGSAFQDHRADRSLALPRRTDVVPLLALVLGCIVTAASFETSWVHLAYRLPRMHAVIDTTIGLVSLLVAYLVYGRVEAFHKRRD